MSDPASAADSGAPRKTRPLWWHMAALCLSLLVPALVLAGVLGYFYVSAERERLDRAGLDAAREAAQELSVDLNRLTSAAALLSRSPALRAGDLDRFRLRIEDTAPQLNVPILFLNPGGGRPVFGTTATGALLAQPLPETGRPGHPAPAGQTSIVDISGDAVTGAVSRIDQPVRDGDRVIGFISPIVTVDHIRTILQQIGLPSPWAAIVVNRSGQIIFAPGAGATGIGQALPPGLWDAAAHRPRGVVMGTTPGIGGGSVVAAFSHVDPAGWTVFAIAPASEATAPLRRSVTIFGTSAVALTLLAYGLVLRFARQIARPIEALATEALGLAKGESIQAPRTSIQEVAAVGAALADAAAIRLEAEAVARRSAEWFRVLFAGAPVPIALVDPDSLLVIALSDRAKDLLGLPEEEIKRLRIHDFDVGLTEAQKLAIQANLRTADGPVEFESRISTAGGTTRDIVIRAKPIVFQDRPAIYVAWVDITERRAADRELRRMSALQSAILDALPANVALLDHDGRVVAVNQAWHRFGAYAGLVPEDVPATGANYLAVCRKSAEAGDRQAADVLAGLTALLRGETDRLELVYPCEVPNRRRHWFALVAAPDAGPRMPDADGRGAVVLHLDVTEQVEARQELANSEERLRLFIDRAPAAIAIFDLNMRYIATSRRYLTDYGVADRLPPSGGVAGMSHYALFPEIPERWREIHRRVLAGETLASEAEAFPRPDGHTDWVRWEMTPWRRADGSVGGALLSSEVVTSRVQAEIALRASEERLRMAIEGTELGTWDEDMVTGRVVWNENTFHILGLDPTGPTLDRAEWASIVHPADRELVDRAFNSALAGNVLFQCEHRIVRPDGEIRWISPRGRFIRDANRSAVRFVGVFSDITVLKRASESQDRLRQLIDQSGDFIATSTLDLRLTYLNRGGRDLIGLPEGLSIGTLDVADYVTPAALVLLHSEIIPAMATPQGWSGSAQLEHMTTKAKIDVRGSCFGLRDHDGALIGYAAVMRDITAEKQTMAALAEREALFRSILETVPDGMVLIDQRGIIQSFSATAERMFGYGAAEAIGRNVSMLMPATDRFQHDDYIGRYLRTGERRIIGIGRVVTGQRRDGSTFPLELAVGELHIDGTRLFTGFVRDLTERLATQARLQELQSELAHVSRLSDAGAMTAAIAHELNQPLTAIASSVRAANRLLKADDGTSDPALLREALVLAAEQALRAGHIIRRLREFVVRDGDTDMRMEQLPALIEEASALALLGAGDAGIHFSTQLAPDLPRVLADRVQIQQVLVNLLRNAVQAMTDEEAGATERRDLTVSARVAAPGLVEIAVSDTGPGVAAEIRDRLFEPFVTTKTSGMGVGLSVCRSIVQAHGGELSVEPNPGGGTVFRFTLPAGQFGAEGDRDT